MSSLVAGEREDVKGLMIEPAYAKRTFDVR